MRFVDTSYWVALTIRSEREHSVAKQLATRSPLLITTNYVIGETWTVLRRRASHHVAVDFLDTVREVASLEITRVQGDVEEDALRWLRRHDERPYSFVDATSFAVMRRRRIREALAFDRDFSAAGFIEVRPA